MGKTSHPYPFIPPHPHSPSHSAAPSSRSIMPLAHHDPSSSLSQSQSNANADAHAHANAARARAQPRRRRHRSPFRILTSILYHTSFSFFILLLAIILVVSAFALSEQALRPVSTGRGQETWNFIFIVGSYVVLGFISIAHVWSRLLSIKKILRTMPKPYIPTKQMDVPKKVADHIMVEYSRTAVIAHISQATKGSQDGWGKPGTKWENQHFRTFILGTISTMRQALAPSSSAPSHSLSPLLSAADTADENGATRMFVNSWANLIEQARYSKREPTELDATACETVVDLVVKVMELKRTSGRGENTVNADE